MYYRQTSTRALRESGLGVTFPGGVTPAMIYIYQCITPPAGPWAWLAVFYAGTTRVENVR